MRVLFISSQFPSCSQPELGIFSLNIVREIMRSAEIKVIAPVPDLGLLSFINRIKKYKTDTSIPAFELIEDIEVYHPRYFAAPRMGFLHHNAMMTSLEPLITNLHKTWKIDAINCHWLFPDGVAVQRIASRLGIPLMLTALGCDLNQYTKLITRKSKIVGALLGCDKLSVLNNDMFSKCVTLGVPKEKIVVLPNGVDLIKFCIKDKLLMRRLLKLPVNDKIILFVGSLVEVKNVHSLLNAYSILSKNNPNIKLVIAGSGYLQENLKNLSKKLGIQESICFLGKVDHDALPDLMNTADCLCLPSIREGHPNVMMEALACGVPVVASKLGSMPDFICNDNGFLIDRPTDSNEIAAKILKCLVSNYDRGLIRNKVVHLSWVKCAENYLDELHKLVVS